MAASGGGAQRYAMTAMRLFGGALGCTLIALAIYRFATEFKHASVSLNHAILAVRNLDRLIFGLLILLAECRFARVLAAFSFLTHFSGLGAFYIFIGGLALDDTGTWYEIALMVAALALGGLYLVSACGCSNLANEYHEEAQQAADAATAKSDVVSDIERPVVRKPNRPSELEDGDSRRERLLADPFASSDDQDYNAREPQRNNGPFSSNKSAYAINDDDDLANPFARNEPRKGAY